MNTIFIITILVLVVWIKRLQWLLVEERYKKLSERNSAVRWFRSWYGNKYGVEKKAQLPPYDSMFESDLPIEEENFDNGKK